MKIALTGATGFIGTRLVNRLLADHHQLTILTRHPRDGRQPRYVAWNAGRNEAPAAALEGADAVIHLAGEPVAQRWTREAKARIRSSRIDGTRHLVSAMAKLPVKPAVLVSASAIGIYGSRGDEMLTEESAPGAGFLENVTVEWEREARRAEEFGVRVVPVRIGIVLGRDGGALKKMLPPFRAGVGGRIGSGGQWMSWIHVDDLVEMVVFALTHDALRGPINGTGPEPVTNAAFTYELAQRLRRPAFLPVPGFALRLLFGEMASVVLASQRVMPDAARAAGFPFRYPTLHAALAKILG